MRHIQKEGQRRVCIQKLRCAWENVTLGANCWHIGIKYRIEWMDNAVSSRILEFICEFPCFFTPSRPNTSINFFLVDVSKPKLCLSLSLFTTKVWLTCSNTIQLHWDIKWWCFSDTLHCSDKKDRKCKSYLSTYFWHSTTLEKLTIN